MTNSFINNFNSLLSIARDLYNRGDFQASKSKFESCLELSPNEPLLLFEYGCCLFHLNDFDNSIIQLQKLIKTDTKHARAHALLGTIYSDLGERAKASEHHYQAIKSEATLTQSAYGFAKTCKVEVDSDEYHYLKSLLNQPNLNLNDQIRVHFSLAEIHLQNNDFKGQVECLRKANQLAERCFPFNGKAQQQNTTRIIDGFSKIQDFNLLETENNGTPIFILGLPRSGSTLLEQMLSGHSQFQGIGETDILSRTVGFITQNFVGAQNFPEEVNQLQKQHWLQAAEILNQQFAINTSENTSENTTVKIVDKQLFNFTLAGFAKIMNPDSLFIDLRRNPGAQFISCYSILFGENRGFTHHISRFVEAYNNQRRLIQFWQQKFPENFITLYYEKLVADPQQTLEEILAKVNAKFESACLDFHKSKQAVTSASQLQVKQPVYTQAIDRWANYQQLMPLESEILQPLIDEYQQQQLEQTNG